ncbi:hypothetical protein EV196_104137 [Mariniflexile fucanivorans]|uniref:Uncharacterized protein n=1 Tax=Mariniflexile fucanivorans TaxID=264023 RepID=A0A4V2QDY8_9FLAO|nr:hypothetical protein [Mariniflexile fucanivorans]TCL66107.1 hypothetical protein EV196_104137 [Mariniflexile fucanivorans]
MKKLVYTFLLLATVGIISTSCREKKTAGEKVEDGVEEVGDGIEDAADDVSDEVEDAVD